MKCFVMALLTSLFIVTTVFASEQSGGGDDKGCSRVLREKLKTDADVINFLQAGLKAANGVMGQEHKHKNISAKKNDKDSVEISVFDDEQQTQRLCVETVVLKSKLPKGEEEKILKQHRDETVRAHRLLEEIRVSHEQHAKEQEEIAKQLPPPPEPVESDFYENAFGEYEIIIEIKDDADEAEAMKEINKEEYRVIEGSLYNKKEKRLSVPKEKLKFKLEELQKNKKVKKAYPNVKMNYLQVPAPNDPYVIPNSSSSWHLDKISAYDAWNISVGTYKPVAMVDSGILFTHEDLNGAVEGEQAVYAAHGTMVAGIIAGIGDNGKGSAGVNRNGKIYSFSTPGSAYDMKQALLRAANSSARVINISMGSTIDTVDYKSAVDYATSKGKLVVAAAGNEYYNSNQPVYPAAYSNALSVGATNPTDNLSLSAASSYGPFVNVSAPGEYFYTTYDYRYSPYGTYTSDIHGTSEAAPIVSGIASLIWSVNPKLSNSLVMDIIKRNTDSVPPAPGTLIPQSKHGRVNAKKALQEALNTVRPRDGDANADGQGFDISDCLMTLRIAIGLYPQTASVIKHVDVAPLCTSFGGSCSNGTVDVADALVMMQILVGLISTNFQVLF